MKRSELKGLHAALVELAESATGKLAYAVVKNTAIVEKELKDLEELGKPSAEVQAYDKERVGLCAQMCRKTDAGAPVLNVNPATGLREYEMEDPAAFQAAMGPVRDKYAAALAAHDAKMEKFFALLDEESDLQLYKIAYSEIERDQKDLPADRRITAAMLKRIWPIVMDDEPAK